MFTEAHSNTQISKRKKVQSAAKEQLGEVVLTRRGVKKLPGGDTNVLSWLGWWLQMCIHCQNSSCMLKMSVFCVSVYKVFLIEPVNIFRSTSVVTHTKLRLIPLRTFFKGFSMYLYIHIAMYIYMYPYIYIFVYTKHGIFLTNVSGS